MNPKELKKLAEGIKSSLQQIGNVIYGEVIKGNEVTVTLKAGINGMDAEFVVSDKEKQIAKKKVH